jgi:predicted Fe-Mo cluster-binding NifX family protein
MKIAITVTNPTLNADLDVRFGRCPYFLLVDSESMEVEIINNSTNAQGGGAGIQSAQSLAKHHVAAVLTGNCGPNAQQVLCAAGIDVYLGCNGTVSETLARFKAGELTKILYPSVQNDVDKTTRDEPQNTRRR